MQATSTFIEVFETLNMASDNPVISEIRTPLEKLQLILKKVYQKLGPEFTSKFNTYCRLYVFPQAEWKPRSTINRSMKC
jgi:hypothetical protein